MAASTRRAALGAILAAPLASVPAVASDPHACREAQARANWRRHKDTDHGLSEPNDTPANKTAQAAIQVIWDFAAQACDMPRPKTLAGLGVLALSLAMADEQYVHIRSGDAGDWRYVALLEAILEVSSIALPVDHRGMVYDPDAEAETCA